MIDMRNYFACLFLIFFVSAYSQEIVKEYQLPDKHSFQDIELLSIGDTLIVNMSLDFRGRAQLMSYLIPPDTSLTPFPYLHATNKNPICGIVSLSRGIKRLYYLDQAKKEFRIKAVEANFEDKRMIDVPGELVLNGRMLAML